MAQSNVDSNTIIIFFNTDSPKSKKTAMRAEIETPLIFRSGLWHHGNDSRSAKQHYRSVDKKYTR